MKSTDLLADGKQSLILHPIIFFNLFNLLLIYYRFDNLCKKAEELEVEDDAEVNMHLQKFVPFSKDDVETLSHIKVYETPGKKIKRKLLGLSSAINTTHTSKTNFVVESIGEVWSNLIG